MTVPAGMPPVQSPRWWLTRLYKKLQKEQESYDFFNDYYTGAHPLPWLHTSARDEFRRILKMTRANYMGLVCDSVAERANPIGFRIGEEMQGDKDSAAIWQFNNMDFYGDMAILESLIARRSYLSVEPNAKNPKRPFIYAEHPTQVIVEYVPGSNRRERAAGLKVFTDDWTGNINATVYLPADGLTKALLYKFTAKAPPTVSGETSATWQPNWEERHVAGETWPAVNPLGKVPFYELPNNPRLLPGGVSEIADVVDIQDRINKTIADRLITQDYGAFPQKWSTAWPDEDDEGNPQPKIDVGRDRMVTSALAETKFGQWEASPLDPYSAAKREDVKDIASRTRTPAQYLLGELSNVNGETLKAAESGLISKVRQRFRGWDDGMEECMADARQLAGLPTVEIDQIEVMWRNPEYRTDGELVDGLTKMAGLHVPFQVLWEKWGATPAELARWLQLAKDNATDPALAKVFGEPGLAPNERITLTDPSVAPPIPAQAVETVATPTAKPALPAQGA